VCVCAQGYIAIMPIIIIEKPLNSKNKNKNKNKSTSPALPVAAAAAAAAAPLPLPHPVPVLDADEKLASTHIQVCAFFSSSSASSPPKQRWVGAGTLFTTNKYVWVRCVCVCVLLFVSCFFYSFISHGHTVGYVFTHAHNAYTQHIKHNTHTQHTHTHTQRQKKCGMAV